MKTTRSKKWKNALDDINVGNYTTKAISVSDNKNRINLPATVRVAIKQKIKRFSKENGRIYINALKEFRNFDEPEMVEELRFIVSIFSSISINKYITDDALFRMSKIIDDTRCEIDFSSVLDQLNS
jgi:hypothetical protein